MGGGGGVTEAWLEVISGGGGGGVTEAWLEVVSGGGGVGSYAQSDLWLFEYTLIWKYLIIACRFTYSGILYMEVYSL